MAEPKRGITDLRHDATLALSIMAAFASEAPKYGVRLVGIEDDANEHGVFWLAVARELLRSNP